MSGEATPSVTELLELVRTLTARIERLEAENQQLREENVRLREENTRLNKRIGDLERRQKKTVAPFGRDTPKADPQPSGRRAGQGTFSYRAPPQAGDITRVIEVPLPTTCPCGGALEAQHRDLASLTDLPERRPRVTAYHLAVGQCRRCGRRVRASHPDVRADQRGATAHRLGPEVLSLAHSLHYDLGVPVRKVPEVVRLATGLIVTQGALTQDALRQSAAGGELHTQYRQLRDDVQRQPFVHQDDTGWRVHGKQAWLQVFRTPVSAIYQIRSRHTHAEVQELVPKDYAGVLCVDRFSSYDHASFTEVAQQKCLHHVVRSCEAALENQQGKRGRGRDFARALLEDLRAALTLHAHFHAGNCTLEAYQRQGRWLTSRLEKRLFAPCRSRENKRLVQGIRKHHERGNLLRFLHNPEIAPTNNAAERALRPAVIARKVSQCSKTTGDSDAFAIFKSLTQTARLAGLDPFQTLLDHRQQQNTR